MIRDVDEDGNGTIDFGEFLQMMAKKLNQINIEAELLDAFKVYDRDGNGLVSITELRYFLINSIPTLTHEEVDEIAISTDKDGDGHIDLEEFLQLLFN